MTPLNQPERRTRLWQFALLYLVALLIPLAASYYLFSNNSLADENARLKKELDTHQQEQQILVARFDTLSRQLRRINAVDQSMRDQQNQIVLGKLNIQNQDYLTKVALTLSQLSDDSARFQVPAHRLLARNELRDFNLFRANRSTIDALREQINSNGSSAQRNAQLAEDLSQAKMDLSQAKQQIIMLQAMTRPPVPSGGGSNKSNHNEADSQQIINLQNELAFANASCTYDKSQLKKHRSQERKVLLEQARNAYMAILQKPVSEGLKSRIDQALKAIDKD